MRIWVIALNTFLETIRDRVLRMIVGLSLLVIIISKAIGEVSIGQDLKIIADLSLGAIDFFGMILCVFIGTSLIYKEMDKRTLYTVLACPLRRIEFILGKYLGMALTLAVTVLIMGSVFCIFFWISGGTLHAGMLAAVLMLLAGLMLLNAIAVFFSTMASPTVSAISTVAIFIIGRTCEQLEWFATMVTGTMHQLVLVLYYSLPNLTYFNVKLAAVHALPLPWSTVGWSLAYGAVYSGFVLYLAALVFARRNL